MDAEWLKQARSLRGSADFKEAHVFVEPFGDDWRVSVVAMPVSVPLTSDRFPERDLALARAQDFERLVRMGLQVDVVRRYRGKVEGYRSG